MKILITAQILDEHRNDFGILTVVQNGANGFTIKPYNISQFAVKLKMILSDEINLETIRKAVAENLNRRDYIEKLKYFYAKVIV